MSNVQYQQLRNKRCIQYFLSWLLPEQRCIFNYLTYKHGCTEAMVFSYQCYCKNALFTVCHPMTYLFHSWVCPVMGVYIGSFYHRAPVLFKKVFIKQVIWPMHSYTNCIFCVCKKLLINIKLHVHFAWHSTVCKKSVISWCLIKQSASNRTIQRIKTDWWKMPH